MWLKLFKLWEFILTYDGRLLLQLVKQYADIINLFLNLQFLLMVGRCLYIILKHSFLYFQLFFWLFYHRILDYLYHSCGVSSNFDIDMNLLADLLSYVKIDYFILNDTFFISVRPYFVAITFILTS
jgi:hypothetical protein